MHTGFVCFSIESLSVEYTDQAGILHENFFLLPIGFLFVFCGCSVTGISLFALR